MKWMALKSGSDVRGIAYGDNAALTQGVAQAFGGAFARYVAANCEKDISELYISIGRDSRITGEALASAVAQGIINAGANAVIFGLCTTPAMYMSVITEGFQMDGAVMVTASHHPYMMNGLKFFDKNGGLDGNEVKALIEEAEIEFGENKEIIEPGVQGSIIERAFLPEYIEILKKRIRDGLDTDVAMPLLGLHVVVDAGNGAGGFYAELLASLGAWIEGSQFLEPDGMFPNHKPNPEDSDAMASLAKAVKENGADLGVIFDADCDRAAIVDGTGKEINRNRLIALVSAMLLNNKIGLTIVTDSVTSSGLAQFISDWGGEHYRYKRGYRNVIDEAIRLNEMGIDCPLAIETSGHAAFRENYFLDDGMYLVTVLIVQAMKLKQEGKTLGSMIEDLREPVESVELRLPITIEDFQTAGREAITWVLDYASTAEGWVIAPDNREGVRINFNLGDGFENGWFLLRLSVHDPVLPLNAESDIRGGIHDMLLSLLAALDEVDGIDLEPINAYLENVYNNN